MMTYEVWRRNDERHGCVDFLGEIEADCYDSAESIARLMYPCDYGAGEKLDVIPVEAFFPD